MRENKDIEIPVELRKSLDTAAAPPGFVGIHYATNLERDERQRFAQLGVQNFFRGQSIR